MNSLGCVDFGGQGRHVTDFCSPYGPNVSRLGGRDTARRSNGWVVSRAELVSLAAHGAALMQARSMSV